jgi:tRNA G18 (ribose-2'-O)-methylase SpoU
MADLSDLEIIDVQDANDPRLDDYRSVRDRDLRGAGGRGGLFIGEQSLVVERMLSLPGVVKSVLVSPRHLDRLAPKAPPGTRFFVAPLEIMQEVAGFAIHRGVLAAGYRAAFDRRTPDDVAPAPGRPCTVLLLEEIRNIDNIGMLFRNAAAFGVDAVVLSPGCHDPLYRKSLRVSIGHALTTPWARSADWPADLDLLRDRWRLSLVGAALDRGAVPLDELEPPPRTGLLVGEEYAGLREATCARCDALVRIPMAPGVDSLNVGVAAAVCLHRLSRAARR